MLLEVVLDIYIYIQQTILCYNTAATTVTTKCSRDFTLPSFRKASILLLEWNGSNVSCFLDANGMLYSVLAQVWICQHSIT